MVFLSPANDVSDCNQYWMLDYRIEGTFMIVSISQNHLVITCENVTSSIENMNLVMRRFTGENSQLWRFDGGYLEPVIFEGHAFTYTSDGQSKLVLAKKEDNELQLFQNKVRLNCCLWFTSCEVGHVIYGLKLGLGRQGYVSILC